MLVATNWAGRRLTPGVELTVSPRRADKWVSRGIAKALEAIPEETHEEVIESTLPEGFPGRDALAAAGFYTTGSLVGMTQTALVGLKGIGPATAKAILRALE